MLALDLVVLPFGRPACGKGTIFKRLADDFRIERHVTSDILRMDATPEDLRKIDSGQLGPDDVVLRGLEDRIQTSRVVIDCIRSVEQVRWLSKHLAAFSKVLLFNIQVSEEEVRRRIANASLTERGVRVDDSAIDERIATYSKYEAAVLSELGRLRETKCHFINGEGDRDSIYNSVLSCALRHL